jgi:hypothetical protein
VETPRKFITAKLSIRKPRSSSVLIMTFNNYSPNQRAGFVMFTCAKILKCIISTDEDPGLGTKGFQ